MQAFEIAPGMKPRDSKGNPIEPGQLIEVTPFIDDLVKAGVLIPTMLVSDEDPGPEEEQGPETFDEWKAYIEGLTKPHLVEYLKAGGIEFPQNASKADLVALALAEFEQGFGDEGDPEDGEQ
ncbi:MAG: hypothetical protein R3F33_11110 [Planctomycetota bacterium]